VCFNTRSACSMLPPKQRDHRLAVTTTWKLHYSAPPTKGLTTPSPTSKEPPHMQSLMESAQMELSGSPDIGLAINQVAAEPAQNKAPEAPDMDLAIRQLAIAYFFQLGLQQKEISERLNFPKTALSNLISTIKKRVPNHESVDIRVLLAAAPLPTRKGAPYITKSTTMPAIGHEPGNHRLRRAFEAPRPCTQCRHLNRQDRSHKVRRTRLCCITCGESYPVCDTCQYRWHSRG